MDARRYVNRPSACATAPDSKRGRRSWSAFTSSSGALGCSEYQWPGKTVGSPDSVASCCRLRYMSSTSPPGKSVRPQPSRNRCRRRPDGRRAGSTGCPGVAGSAAVRSPGRRRPPCRRADGVRSDSGMSVTRETHLASWIFTCTGTVSRSRSSARPLSVKKPIMVPPTWSGGGGNDQDAGQSHAVGFQGCRPVRPPHTRDRPPPHHRFPVADQIGEVAHLRGDHVAGGEVVPGQQLL